MPSHPLDNPIWSALTTKQAHLAYGSSLAQRFPADISPLCGIEAPTPEAMASLAEITLPRELTILFLEATPQFSSEWRVIELNTMPQMVYESKDVPAVSIDFIELTEADVPEMVALTVLTKPGPFLTRTRELGDYIGIRRGGQLVAISGERLHVPGYTEVSAVCTHPDHLGHGYARALMFEIMRRIIARDETPFLHTRTNNDRAITLYEHLGFTTRRRINLAVLSKSFQLEEDQSIIIGTSSEP
jgi:predicted GNAT family acetyltransferase